MFDSAAEMMHVTGYIYSSNVTAQVLRLSPYLEEKTTLFYFTTAPFI